ncbi:type III-A CRISPR-associated RAMP protein Csm4 [Methanobrevibacter curvatus]|uniref:CRISPR system Cms protein Csm4 n=1 Tax=Methanobrevibacter curvatus TaxID=49547 RepID=A0A162FML6_9EURY|nr:type III-A CRISPR-associated RAMP protein Csm4 [Methanobrevibacter curvatus]KZX12270.1 hypothetical protein MBCUR_11220 [Methanobrevibacter curvatus]
MLVYIKPLSIFPSLHSGTIFGAIISAISQLYSENKVDELINSFQNTPPFVVSSAFPVILNENKLNESIKFFPKIINIYSSDGVHDKRKKYKKVDFIQESIFFDLINGRLGENELLNKIDDEYLIKNNLLFKKELKGKLNNNKFKQTVIPNNSVNRLTNSSDNIFYTEGYEFSNMGLFFLINFNNNNEEYKTLVKSALKFLKDKGFGRDISNGKGHFEFLSEDILIENDFNINEKENRNNDSLLILSRVIPDIESNDLKKFEPIAYEFGSKRSRGSAGDLRKEVKFFKEGSTFKCNYEDFLGQVVKVNSINTPPAIEYGLAFPLFFRREI